MLIILSFIFIICIFYIIYIKKNDTKSSEDSDDEIVNDVSHSDLHSDLHSDAVDIDNLTNIVPLYLDKPSKLLNLYFPYININYMDTQLKYTSIDTIIQSIDGYENKIYDILTNTKYDKLLNGIFIIKPEYKILYNIFYAYMINRKNSTLIKNTDVKNKYIIKRLFNDMTYLYIVPFTETIQDIKNIPEITDYNMIDTMCKKNDKYIQCKIKIIPPPTNFQKIDDMYYDYISKYITILIFIDIMELAQPSDKCNLIIKQEQIKANEIKKILEVRVPLLF
jgi:hypothetical protein